MKISNDEEYEDHHYKEAECSVHPESQSSKITFNTKSIATKYEVESDIQFLNERTEGGLNQKYNQLVPVKIIFMISTLKNLNIQLILQRNPIVLLSMLRV